MKQPIFNPFRPEVQENPHPLYARLRLEDPVHFNASAGIWFLTRHVDIVAMLTNPIMSAAQGQQVRQRETALPPSMLTTDPPLHTRLRKAAAPALARSVVDAAVARLEPIVDEVLDWADDVCEMDLVSAYAGPLAAITLMELLGIKRPRLAEFYALARAAAVNLDPLTPIAETDSGVNAADRLAEFFRPFVEGTAAVPAASAIGVLRGSIGKEGGQSTEEAIATCTLAVIGGFEPLRDFVTAVLTLLRNPAVLARLRDRPSLIHTAIDELIRFDAPIPFSARVPLEDLRIGDCQVLAGQPVVALLSAANRDESVFCDADTVNLKRAPNPHLGFGAGPHYCLGAVAAKASGAVLVGKLFRRFPDTALVDHVIRWRPRLVPRGLDALQVRLHARSTRPAR